MALKTQENNNSVDEFINSAATAQQDDAKRLAKIMAKVTNTQAKMWGDSIVGFGRYHYQNTGKGGVWPVVGFSPRKNALTIYIMTGFELYPEIMQSLGKYKTGKSCLYIKQIADIDEQLLEQLIALSIEEMKTRYRCEFD